MTTSRPLRKRQAQLTFSPLPSSSPAAASYNSQIRDRAAAVGYGGSPSPAKRRKVQEVSSYTSRIGGGIPTPEASNDIMTNGAGKDVSRDSDSDHVTITKPETKTKHRTRQQRLEFAPESSMDVPISSARVSRSQNAPKNTSFFRSQTSLRDKRTDSEMGSSESEDEPPTSVRTSSRMRRSKNLRSAPIAKPVAHMRRASDQFVDLGNQTSDDSDLEVLPTTPAKSRNKSEVRTDAIPHVQVDSDSDSDIGTARSRRRADASSSVDLAQLSEDDDEMPQSSVKRNRRKQRKRSDADTDDDAQEVVELSSGSEALPRKKGRRTREEQQEIEDDLLDLQSGDSDDIASIYEPKRAAPRNPRQEALERLKRRRAGENVIELEDESPQEDGQEDQSDVEEVTRPAQTYREMFLADDDDEGFLTDQGEDSLGAPTSNIPIEFTRYASMKAKELFKYAVGWMVQKKINPAFVSNDELYDLTFKKLDDEVKGLAGSKFTSAAWTQDFTFALRARPQIAFQGLNRSSAEHWMRDRCDACNRSGHPATYQIQFQGIPYHKETLEEIAGDDDSDTDAESESGAEDRIVRDAQGRQIVSADTTFYVGKFCMANAETAHALEHWRFHLYEWVVDWLETTGYNTPEMIVKRDKWNERKRRKYANQIVDDMEKQGKIKDLYHDFRSEVDKARDAKQGRWDASP